jgi:Transposase DDE domain
MSKSHALQPYTSLYWRYSETISSALGRAPICFDRDRKLGPLQVMLTMQAAHFAGSQEGGQSWEDALDSAANSLSDDPVWRNRFRVSRAAFHQAIKKVDAEDQAQLWEVCRNMFPASADSSLSELHGIRFAHVDGTQVRTPRSDELLKVVGTQTNGPNQSCHFPVGKSVLMLEAGTQRILGHELCRCKAFDKEKEPILVREERAAWRVVRERITEKYAVIADSGFASHEDFAELIAEGKHFLVAVQKSWKIIAKFRATKQSDAIVTIPMPHDRSRTLTLRIFTIRDGDNNTRYVATSLREPFTLSECRRLYKTRWAIETWFRYAKQFFSMRKLRSATLHGVRLEILAILMLMQAIAAIRTAIAHHVNNIADLLCTLQKGFRKAKFRTAIRAATRIIRDALNNTGGKEPPPEFMRLIQATIPYEPGRKFKRTRKGPAIGFIPRRPDKTQRKALKNQGVAS